MRRARITDPEWITADQAALIMRRHPEAVRRLGRKGAIRTHETPGCHVRYAKVDVLQFAPPEINTSENASDQPKVPA